VAFFQDTILIFSSGGKLSIQSGFHKKGEKRKPPFGGMKIVQVGRCPAPAKGLSPLETYLRLRRESYVNAEDGFLF